MSAYVLRRLWLLVPALFGMSLLVFFMLRLLPGDIVDVMTGGDIPATAGSKERLREAFGLDQPLPVQYVSWLSKMAHGDLGTSFRSGEPISTILVRTLPVTMELTLLAVVVATLVAIPLGVISAVARESGFDYVARLAGLIGLSMPNFWLATLMLLFTSAILHWIPPVNWIPLFQDPVGNLRQMALPAAAIALQLMAILMRMTRTMMLEVLQQDYVRTARAKGAVERLVVFRHALRNALIPVVSVIGFQIGALMGGSAIVEVIFGLNGIGNTLVQAIFNRDYPVVQATTLFVAVVFVFANLGVDLLYGYLDPRLKHA
ncbi:MAG: ABC transporter permease [Chloroflexota bacterium]|nr:ABC transporter permease [Chloroflexota bacterium]